MANIAIPQPVPLGLTGATAATRYVGATTSGAPASGTFAVGDFVVDQSGQVFVCTVAGTPGTWTPSYLDALRQAMQALGAKSWNADPRNNPGGTAGPTTQHTVSAIAPTWAGETYTGVAVNVISAGSGFNKIQVALYSYSGATQHAVSTDQKALFGGTGWIQVPFASTFTPTTSGGRYIGLYFDASTVPTLRRFDASIVANKIGSGQTLQLDVNSGSSIAATLTPTDGQTNSIFQACLY